jgi:hypothetical protein
MCCFFASLLFFGPRLAFIIYWIWPTGRLKVNAAFNGSWLVPLIGLLVLPWTTLVYVIVFPVAGWDLLWIGLAIAGDIAGYGSSYRSRNQVPGYTGP